MKILVTGATGFVGRALVARLAADGHAVIALSRDPDRAGETLGVEAVETDRAHEALSRCDAVVHLAGETLEGRWTAAKKERIRTSRLEGTRALVQALSRAEPRPRTLVQASAVGWYGDRRDEVDESGSPGDGYLAGICQAWEQAGAPAEALGLRRVVVRIGVVLGTGGGVLRRLVPMARKGLAGRVGSGRQPMPWIHRDDLVELLVRALTDEGWRGVFNGVAGTTSQGELATVISRAVGRRGGLPAPAWAVKLGLGEAATLVLDGAPVRSSRLPQVGFRFRFGQLEPAVRASVG